MGTGTGHAALTIAALGHRVTGLDIAPAMLAHARDNARRRGLDITFVEGDAVRPAVDGAPFDVLVSRYVLWTLPDVDTALGNWRRLLRPGGRLAVVDAPWHAGGMQHPDTDRGPALRRAPRPGAGRSGRHHRLGGTDRRRGLHGHRGHAADGDLRTRRRPRRRGRPPPHTPISDHRAEPRSGSLIFSP